MKVTAVNRGAVPVILPGEVKLAAGASQVLTGLDRLTALYAMGQSSRDVIIRLEFDAADNEVAVADMASPADPSADATYQTGVGFTLKNQAGTTLAVNEYVGLGVFDDEACTVPSTTAYLQTATTGSIVSGSGTNTLKVLTASGIFACRVTIPAAADKTFYFAAFPLSDSSRLIDGSEVDAIAFTTS